MKFKWKSSDTQINSTEVITITQILQALDCNKSTVLNVIYIKSLKPQLNKRLRNVTECTFVFRLQNESYYQTIM